MNKTALKPAPKPRRDGTCYVCREPYKITPRTGVNPAAYVDPFCSATCARRYYGTEVLTPTGRPEKEEET